MVSNTQTAIPDPASTGVSRKGTKWIFLVLAVVALLLLAVEAVTRVFVPRISRIDARIEREHAELIRLPQSANPLIVVLGNSLLDSAVQFDRVKTAFHGEAEVRRYVVERTTYRDWEFGLPRLFDEGMRPKILVLMFTPEQLLANTVRGDFFASRMMRKQDLLKVASTLNLHPTEASGMAFASISRFYGMRAEIRQVVLGRLMPELPKLTTMLVPPRGLRVSPQQIRATAPQRLRTYAELCRRYGTQFVLALAPLAGKVENSLVLEQVAREAGIPCIRPFESNQFRQEDFTDGFHMSEETSAKLFTPQFIEALRPTIPHRAK